MRKIPAGFRTAEGVRRVIKAARATEGMSQAGMGAGDVTWRPAAAGLPTVHVKVTEEGGADGYYFGVYVYPNPEWDGSNPDEEWLEFDDDPECVIRDVNAGPLEVGKRYSGETIGLFDFEDGGGEPADVWNNGYPLVYAESGATGAARCLIWFSEYLHLGTVTVAEGDTLTPSQQIGTIGPYASDAPHLHLAIGDGDPRFPPGGGTPLAGTAIEIDDWSGFTVTGTRVGTPVGVSRFTADEIQTIKDHFGIPVDEELDWSISISSAHHTLWDYYAVDFALLGDPPAAVGEAVYAAFTGTDVTTTVEHVRYYPGEVQFAIVLRHQIGECDSTDCGDYKTDCENGYFKRYKCDGDGNWTFDKDFGTRCGQTTTAAPPWSPSPLPPPPAYPYPGPQVQKFPAVGKVCVRRGHIVEVTESYEAEWTDDIVHALSGGGAVTVTLPAATTDPLGADGAGASRFMVKRIGANGVSVAAATGTVDGTTFVGIADDYGWQAFYHDGTDWFTGVALPVTGIKVETREVTIKAAGDVTAPVCVDDPEDCCAEEPAPDVGCCPLGAAAVLDFVAEFAGGVGGAPVGFAGSLETDDGQLSWSTAEPVDGTGLGAGDSALVMTLYCEGTDWFVEGAVINNAGSVYRFEVPLTDNGEELYTTVDTGGFAGDVFIVIEHPCPTATYASECVDVDCGTCIVQMASAYKVYSDEALTTEVAELIKRTDVGHECEWHSNVALNIWWMWYDETAELWYLSDQDGNVWYTEDWNCCDVNEMYSVVEDGTSRWVEPDEDCCPPPVEPDPGCPPGVCGDVPTTRTWTYTITNKVGGCACLPDTGSAEWNAGASRWEGTSSFTCLMGECEENATPGIQCSGGVWGYFPGGDAPADVSCGEDGVLTVVFNKTSIFADGSYTITFRLDPA